MPASTDEERWRTLLELRARHHEPGHDAHESAVYGRHLHLERAARTDAGNPVAVADIVAELDAELAEADA